MANRWLFTSSVVSCIPLYSKRNYGEPKDHLRHRNLSLRSTHHLFLPGHHIGGDGRWNISFIQTQGKYHKDGTKERDV